MRNAVDLLKSDPAPTTPAAAVNLCPAWIQRPPALPRGTYLIKRKEGQPDELAEDWGRFALTQSRDMDANCQGR